MKTYFHILVVLFIGIHVSKANDWGPTGHRVVGAIAQIYLSPEAKEMINELLDGDSLALVSTYADEIKSDDRFREYYPWHYVNFPFETTYADHPKSEEGDIIRGIAKCLEVLQDGSTSKADKAFHLKLLVHFMGDLHQPLHVGLGEDRGGNDIQIEWFREPTNLHSVWDEKIILQFGMSYSELAENRKALTPSEIRDIQQGSVTDWMYDSRTLCLDVYRHTKEGDKLWYPYMYRYAHTVRHQLHKGGLRLAAILNQVFSQK